MRSEAPISLFVPQKAMYLRYLQIRLMKLSEFQEKHTGDLTGPALQEIKNRQQAFKVQLMPPPATGEHKLLKRLCT